MKALARMFAIVLGASVIPTGAALADAPADPLMALLEQSKAEKKGIMIYANGSQIGGGVTAITPTHVTLRGREYGQIVIRLDRIDGAAGF